MDTEQVSKLRMYVSIHVWFCRVISKNVFESESTLEENLPQHSHSRVSLKSSCLLPIGALLWKHRYIRNFSETAKIRRFKVRGLKPMEWPAEVLFGNSNPRPHPPTQPPYAPDTTIHHTSTQPPTHLTPTRWDNRNFQDCVYIYI